MSDVPQTLILYPASSVACAPASKALEAALRGWHMAGAVLNDAGLHDRIEVLEAALREIAAQDPKMIRADDLGRAARIARAALDKDAT